MESSAHNKNNNKAENNNNNLQLNVINRCILKPQRNKVGNEAELEVQKEHITKSTTKSTTKRTRKATKEPNATQTKESITNIKEKPQP